MWHHYGLFRLVVDLSERAKFSGNRHEGGDEHDRVRSGEVAEEDVPDIAPRLGRERRRSIRVRDEKSISL